MKTFKKIMTTLLAVWLVGSVCLVTAMAQEAAQMEELWREIQEVNKTIPSMKVDGKLHIEASPVEGEKQQVDAEWNGDYNLDPFVGEATTHFNVVSDSSTTDKNVSLVLDQGVLYYQIDGQQWAAVDVSEFTDVMAQQFKQAQDQTETYPEIQKVLGDYFDYEETDKEHVLTLKQNIDGAKLYDDLEKAGFFEAVQKEALKQAENQPAVEGQKVTSEQIQTAVDKLYTKENFVKFFKANPKYLVAYDKETKYLTRLESDMTLAIKDFMSQSEDDQETSEPPIKDVHVALNIVFSNHGQTFDIAVPQGVTVETLSSDETQGQEDQTDQATQTDATTQEESSVE